MVVVYMFIGLPPDCGEGGSVLCPRSWQKHVCRRSLPGLPGERAAQEASERDGHLQLEPDFYGYMQALSNADDRTRAWSVNPDDPSSIPVALNKSGFMPITWLLDLAATWWI